MLSSQQRSCRRAYSLCMINACVSTFKLLAARLMYVRTSMSRARAVCLANKAAQARKLCPTQLAGTQVLGRILECMRMRARLKAVRQGDSQRKPTDSLPGYAPGSSAACFGLFLPVPDSPAAGWLPFSSCEPGPCVSASCTSHNRFLAACLPLDELSRQLLPKGTAQ